MSDTANRSPAEQPFDGMALRETALDRLARRLEHLVRTPEEISMEIALRILESETAEEILNPAETVDAEDLAGAPFVLNAVAISRSNKDGGIGYFATLDATHPETGERMAISCGAANVVVQAVSLYERGFLPIKVFIEVAAKATSRGFYPLTLRLFEKEEAF